MRAASSRAAAAAVPAAGRATAANRRLRNRCNQAIEICVATSYAEKRCAALTRIPHRRARPPVRVQSAGKSRRKEGSHDRAPTVKVVAKAPEFDHGDIENNNPMPLPAVNGNSDDDNAIRSPIVAPKPFPTKHRFNDDRQIRLYKSRSCVPVQSQGGRRRRKDRSKSSEQCDPAIPSAGRM
jgi:hypothetical protein